MRDREREREREGECERERKKERNGKRSINQEIVYYYHYTIICIHDLFDNYTITIKIIFKIKNV